MSERDAFEKWARDLGVNVTREVDGGYAFPSARTSWRGWQASRAAALEEAANEIMRRYQEDDDSLVTVIDCAYLLRDMAKGEGEWQSK